MERLLSHPAFRQPSSVCRSWKGSIEKGGKRGRATGGGSFHGEWGMGGVSENGFPEPLMHTHTTTQTQTCTCTCTQTNKHMLFTSQTQAIGGSFAFFHTNRGEELIPGSFASLGERRCQRERGRERSEERKRCALLFVSSLSFMPLSDWISSCSSR